MLGAAAASTSCMSLLAARATPASAATMSSLKAALFSGRKVISAPCSTAGCAPPAASGEGQEA
eukprot:2689657-Pyramimonas_sp.AAC.1